MRERMTHIYRREFLSAIIVSWGSSLSSQLDPEAVAKPKPLGFNLAPVRATSVEKKRPAYSL